MASIREEATYDQVCLIVDAFEQAAIESETRGGVAAVAHGPLTAMDASLRKMDEVLVNLEKARSWLVEADDTIEAKTTKWFEKIAIHTDKDLADLMLGEDEEGPVRKYIEDCLDCNLRLKFDWQLKPLRMLGSIAGFLDQIEGSLASFGVQLDGVNTLGPYEEICYVLEELKRFCIPDLLMMMLSIKLLANKYKSDFFNVKLDWTVVVGPILSVVTNGILSMVDNIHSIVLAPVDCVVNGLMAANALHKTTRSKITGLSGSLDLDGSARGFELTADMTIEKALKDKTFGGATWTEKITVPVQEGKNYISELIQKLTNGLASLDKLVGGGLAFNLELIGVILFLIDMIAIVKAVIRLLMSNKNVEDWCSFLRENPQLIEPVLHDRFGDVRAETTTAGIALRKGPDTLGVIKVCKRTDTDNQLLQRWITELEGRSNGQ